MKHEWEVLTMGESSSRSSLWFKWRCARCGTVVEKKPPDTERMVAPQEDEFPACTGTDRPKISIKRPEGEE